MNEKHDSLVPRPIADSQSEMIEIVLPNDANPLGALLGGRLMHWIDMAGALAAHRHSRNYVVTASIDHMSVGGILMIALRRTSSSWSRSTSRANTMIQAPGWPWQP